MNEKLMEREQVDESKFAPPTLKTISFPKVEHRSKVNCSFLNLPSLYFLEKGNKKNQS
jgi:hypothetical protein